MGAIDSTWLDARIAKTKELIEAIEDAILTLTSSSQPYVTYTLRTDRTEEVVTKSDLMRLRTTLDHLENRLATLEARRRSGARIGRPGF